MVESAPLLREYTLIAYRGFESLSLRQTKKEPRNAGFFLVWRRERFDENPVRLIASAIRTAAGALQGLKRECNRVSNLRGPVYPSIRQLDNYNCSRGVFCLSIRCK